MRPTNEKIERLKMFVDAGRERFDRDGELNPDYVKYIIIPELKEVLKNILPEIEKQHKFGDDEYSYVVHYTSLNTVISLLKNQIEYKKGKLTNELNTSLRLYDSEHFNDPDEGNYFINCLDLSKEYTRWLGDNSTHHAYIASFIIPDTNKTTSDNLMFWRSYGNDGEGCSLKLRVSNSKLQRIVYGSKNIEYTKKTLKPILNSLSPLIEIRGEFKQELTHSIWKLLDKIRFLYKSDAYEHENEVRIVVTETDIDNKERICFEYPYDNESSLPIRHYYEHEEFITNKLLTTGSLITLGPCIPFPYSGAYYIETLLTDAKLIGTRVRVSKIRYQKS